MYNKHILLRYNILMKKTIVIDIGYMKPSAGGRARSRSRSRSRSRGAGAAARSQPRSQSRSRSRSCTHPVEQTEYCNEYEYDEPLNMVSLLHEDGSNDESEEETNDYDDGSDSGDGSDDDSGDDSGDESTSTNSNRHPSITDADYAVNSDDDILQSVLDEPTFPLDVNAILSAMTKTENSTIANMTLKKIAARRHEVLSTMNLTPEKMAEFERKLQMYRVIETPDELKHNQLIRWIPLRSLETRPYITLGGCLFRVRYNEEESLHIVTIRNVKRFVFNIKFELNAVFQRLSQEELLILHAVEYVESPDEP